MKRKHFDIELAWPFYWGLDGMIYSHGPAKTTVKQWLKDGARPPYSFPFSDPGVWVTAEQAADICGVSVRTVNEDYLPLLEAHFPHCVSEKAHEVAYSYDFEVMDLDGYSAVSDPSTEQRNVPTFDVVPDLKGAPVYNRDMHGDDVLTLRTLPNSADPATSKSYDKGLVATSRRKVTTRPRTLHLRALLTVLHVQRLQRVERPTPKRGNGGRFTAN